jgi:hypothetical protein
VSLRELSPGLYRWTASHPDWRPGAAPGGTADWPQAVGCVMVDTAEATVFIDPLVADDDPMWERFDDHVGERALPVVALTTIGFHRRSRDAFVERYEATTSRARKSLPAGIEPFAVRGAGEVMFWLSEHRALVPGDRLLGAGNGGLRLCPESWLGYLPGRITTAKLAELLRPLLDWPIERVLVSHGEPVLGNGRAAVAAALLDK